MFILSSFSSGLNFWSVHYTSEILRLNVSINFEVLEKISIFDETNFLSRCLQDS